MLSCTAGGPESKGPEEQDAARDVSASNAQATHKDNGMERMTVNKKVSQHG